MDLIELLRKLEDTLAAGETAVTATLIETKGATPRKPGAKMLLGPGGLVMGTLGGGCAEAQIFQKGRHIAEEGKAEVLNVDLTLAPDTGSEMICGGRMKILADPWQSAQLSVASLLRKRMESRKPSVLVTKIRGGIVERTVFEPETPECGDLQEELLRESLRDDKFMLHESEDELICIEPLLPPLSMIVAGAGHIGQPTAVLGKMLGFHVTVLDDRDVFACRQRFPTADRILVGNFSDELEKLAYDNRTYVVLLTRGHHYDEECLRVVIPSDAAYVGMIGSLRRVRAATEKLRKEGLAKELFEKLYAPVGLDLGARTPAEIALCIVAEIEKIMRKGTGQSLSRK
jgi:xanthine dehydrogenase accessory factor